ncbi:MAG: polysaccharide biosynthesis/export family protein [Xenococcaceae cyanobacterium MO_188.B32]|nr:polysaccharide biosynthesis/export family protein [Xenococcaceae cyanobacterium MO_188.B32]
MFKGWKIKAKIFARLNLIGAIALIHPATTLALPLSPGDRLEVSIPNEKYFARTYQVNQNGDIEVPFLGAVSVVGLEPIALETKLSRLLIKNNYFPADSLQLSIQILEWAPIQVSVTGELFQPGRVFINEGEEIQPNAISPESLQITGDYPTRRYLTTAIRAAGGVLPTANVRQVRLIRQGRETIIDLSGIFTGELVTDIPLIAGDRIIVPATDFQAELVRPSQITPPGMKVFVSNLTVPATSNASASITNREEGIVFPYGSRFSQAVIATNCAGGTQATNAHRHAVLVRVNRLTGETIYLDRPVEDLLRDSHNEAENPLLMPKDGVACYDSRITNTRDIFKTIGDIFAPLLKIF